MPSIDYEVADNGKAVAVIKGDNGEIQAKTERYDSESNAKRGVSDLARTVLALVADGSIDLSRDG